MDEKMDIVVVIPARYESSRFPGKPIVNIGSKPMLYYIYKACKKSKFNPKVIIATDDKRIKDYMLPLIGDDEIKMTSNDIKTGTDRVLEVVKDIDCKFVLNIQGDEPLLTADVVDTLIEELLNCKEENEVAATLCFKSSDIKEFKDSNIVKLVFDKNFNALYFSRSSIPGNKSNDFKFFYKHIGLYGFKKDFLMKFNSLKGKLEKIESLEQLRILENSYKIKVGVIDNNLIGVDVKEDVEKVKAELIKEGRLL
jgi:3-deoxy-manno-octulosonate cytidylyltransferase (CMP-KDO synthetase)